ncbi:hypothetical protein CARUB_v100186520mg, partial [Capsella rubella]
MAIATKTMVFPNYPFFMSAFGSDENESNSEPFNFTIRRELLLDPKEVWMGQRIGEGANSLVHKG